MPHREFDALPAHLTASTLLGQGAFGATYRARDAAGRDVAVKVLAEAGPDARWRHESEYRHLAALDHPAFPPAYEYGLTPLGRPYFTMALAEGTPPKGPTTPAQVRIWLAQLLEALAHLHGHGLVHGDVKADNMRIAGDALQLFDLGLTRPIGERPQAIQGSLQALGPEGWRQAPAAPALDIYAAGVWAYGLWSGVPPFSGTAEALLRAHLLAVPPELPDGDDALRALIARMLDKEPARRPDVSAALQALGRAAIAARGYLIDAGLMGREPEVAAWRDTLDRGGWLGIDGAAGMGKSALLETFRLEAQLAGRAWVRADAGTMAPEVTARSVTAQLFAQAELTPSATTAAWLAGESREEWRGLDPAVRRNQTHLAVLDDMDRAIAALGNVAIGLDGVDRMDSASLAFFQAVRRRSFSGRVAWVAAGAPGPALERLAARIQVLAPWPEATARAWVEARLGQALPPGLFEAVWPLTGGLPRDMNALLEHLVASGRLAREGAAWRFKSSGAKEGPWALQAAVRDRLSPSTRTLLDVAGLAAPAGALPLAWLAEAVGLEAAEAGRAAEALLAAGIAAMTEDGFLLMWPELAGTDAPPEWATTLARRLAEVPGPINVIRAARLAAVGDDPELAGTLAARGGELCLDAGTPREALALLEGARSTSPETALTLAFARAEARRLLDALEPALADYEAAWALALAQEAPARAAAAGIGAAKCLQMRGDYGGALVRLAAAEAEALRASHHELVARAMLAASRLHLFQGAGSTALDFAQRAADTAHRAGAAVVEAQALNLLGVLIVHERPTDAAAGLALLQEALTLSRRLGDRMGEGTALDNMGNANLSLGDLAGAASAFEAYAEVAAQAGLETEALFADLNVAIVASERGSLSAAAVGAAEVARRAAEAGRKFPWAMARAVAGQAAVRRGRFEDGRGPLDEALETAVAIANRLLEGHVRVVRLEAWLLQAALEAAELELTALASLPSTELAARLTALEAEFARLSGAPERAVALATPVITGPDRLAAYEAELVLAACALDRGEPARCEAHVQAARQHSVDWRSGWHEARADYLEARALAARGRGDKAMRLALGVVGTAGIDAHPWAVPGCALLVEDLGGPPFQAERDRLADLLAALPAAQRARLCRGHGLEALPVRSPAVDVATRIEPARYADAIAAVLETGSETEAATTALRLAAELVAADRGFLLTYEHGRLQRAITHDLDFAEETRDGFSTSIAEEVLFSGQPLYVIDASTDANWQESQSVAALGLRTVIALPVATPEVLLGVLYLDRQAIDPLLTEADLALLGALATAAAAAMGQARTRVDSDTEAARWRACAELGATLLTPEAVGRQMDRVLGACRAAAGAAWAAWLEQTSSGEWRVQAKTDSAGEVDLATVAWAASTGQPSAAVTPENRRVWGIPFEGGVVYLEGAAEGANADVATVSALAEFAAARLYAVSGDEQAIEGKQNQGG